MMISDMPFVRYRFAYNMSSTKRRKKLCKLKRIIRTFDQIHGFLMDRRGVDEKRAVQIDA